MEHQLLQLEKETNLLKIMALNNETEEVMCAMPYDEEIEGKMLAKFCS